MTRKATSLLSISFLWLITGSAFNGFSSGTLNDVLCASTLLLFVANYLLHTKLFPSQKKENLFYFSYLFFSFLTFFLAFKYDFPEPDAVDFYKFYIYFSYVLLIISITLGLSLMPSCISIGGWSLYYIIIYCAYAPFDYIFWLATLLVNTLYFLTFLYSTSRSFQLE